MNLLNIILVGLTLSSSQACAWLYRAPKIIDNEVVASGDIKSVAQEVCDSSQDKQISRISTILKLVDYFDNLSPEVDEKLAACGGRYLNSLHNIRDVIEADQDNVCSDEKVSSIENFHHRFISTVVEDISNREANQEIPSIVRLFFMNYAMEISAICKRGLINNLDWDLKDKFTDEDYKFDGDNSIDMITNAFTKLFKPVNSVSNYDDVLLVSDLIQSSIFNIKSEEVADEGVNPATGEPVRLLIKAKNVRRIESMQQKCHFKFKPIYEKLILPIVRLSDIGYSNNGQQFQKELEELRENKMTRLWYAITQICELILPIKVFQDDTLGPKETVLITKGEAEKISLEQKTKIEEESPTRIEYEPTTNSIRGLDRLESVENHEVQLTIKHLKSDLSVRDREVNRALVRIAQNLKHSGNLKLFFSRKAACKPQEIDENNVCPKNGYIKENMERMLSKSLDDMSEEDLLKLEGSQGIVRNKGRKRKGFDPSKVNNYRQELYMHTKSWSQIFEEWSTYLTENLMPSRRNILIFSVLVFFMGSISLTAFAAAG